MAHTVSAEATLAAVSDAVLGVAGGELSVEAVLERLVAAARELVGARYAALGVPDDEGIGFSRFIPAGLSDEQIDAIGPLPRAHGLLGTLLSTSSPLRLADVTADPRFSWWPEAHPRMRSFLGVPIVVRGEVIGAIYLADKEAAPTFDEGDEQVIGLLAAHAGVALEHARLYETSRELSIAEERDRLARELHDDTVQTLFSLSLRAEVAAGLVRTDADAAVAEICRIQDLARAATAELRAVVFDLRPAALATEGLVAAVRSRLDLLARSSGLAVDLDVTGSAALDPALEVALFRIVQEALTNAARHARATRVDVAIDLEPHLVTVSVSDDGLGFDPASPAIRARRLGLTSMRERAEAAGGSLVVQSAPGAGTTVRVEVPRG